MTENISYFF